MFKLTSVTGNEKHTILNIQILSTFNWEDLKVWMIEYGINPNHGYFRTNNKSTNRIQWIKIHN